MADAAGGTEAPQVAEHRVAIRSVIARGGGQLLSPEGEPSVLAFQSAVEAVRAAVEAQANLRARNKTLAPEAQVDFRIAVTIGEIIDGEAELPEETHAAATRLIGLAAPCGLCISQSVRDAVISKLKVSKLDLTVEGRKPEIEPSTSHRMVIKPAPKPGLSIAKIVKTAAPWAMGAAIGLAAAFVLVQSKESPPPAAAVTAGPAALVKENDVKAKAGESGGTLQYMPAHPAAPDPSAVLTAKRMLPQAWRDCHKGRADIAVPACKLLLDSRIAKGAELAEIQIANGKALRERRELEKAIAAFGASIAASPTSAAYNLRGTVHYDLGHWDPAVADYSEAIRLDPQSGEAFNNRAWTYYRAGRNTEALADADKAVRFLAKEAYVWDTRAHIQARLGNREAAIKDFEAALAIDPSHAESKAGLASLGVK